MSEEQGFGFTAKKHIFQHEMFTERKYCGWNCEPGSGFVAEQIRTTPFKCDIYFAYWTLQ